MEPPEINTSPSIDFDWLDERYRFDAQARCQQIETRVLEYIKGKTPLQILDLGSGLGATTLYYWDILPVPQQWTLVETDEALVQQCLSNLSKWAASHRWSYLPTEKGLKIDLPNKQIEIRIWKDSLLNLENFVDLKKIDLVTANAVFDLFSQEQFQTLAQLLATHEIPLLTTLNYQAMNFEPQDPQDLKYIHLYEQHMLRSQSFGFAMGPACSRQMIAILESLGFTVNWGESVWNLTSSDEKMLNFIFEFMEEAIGELLIDSKEIAQLHQWVGEKKRRGETRQLKLRVSHTDIFARFPGTDR